MRFSNVSMTNLGSSSSVLFRRGLENVLLCIVNAYNPPTSHLSYIPHNICPYCCSLNLVSYSLKASSTMSVPDFLRPPTPQGCTPHPCQEITCIYPCPSTHPLNFLALSFNLWPLALDKRLPIFCKILFPVQDPQS